MGGHTRHLQSDSSCSHSSFGSLFRPESDGYRPALWVFFVPRKKSSPTAALSSFRSYRSLWGVPQPDQISTGAQQKIWPRLISHIFGRLVPRATWVQSRLRPSYGLLYGLKTIHGCQEPGWDSDSYNSRSSRERRSVDALSGLLG